MLTWILRIFATRCKQLTMKKSLEEIVEGCLNGIPATIEEALELEATETTRALAEAADRVRRRWDRPGVDTCSIVNARSGRCPENCKWCAQSRHHSTGVEEYDSIPESELIKAVRLNTSKGVARFSLVTSGRRVTEKDLERFCDMYRLIERESQGRLSMCASMGLLGLEEMKALKAAGVKRYHCNLETASDFFPTLCSTHTHDDKLRTIAAAREAGMEVCSGGIIGMGENMRQRLTLAAEARDAGAVSIPVNILTPVKGTPLENTPLISEEEIERSVALMKLVAPKSTLRFAGGRIRLSQPSNRRLLRGGVGGALVGDMLTTVGNRIDEDLAMFAEIDSPLPSDLD